MAEVPVGTAPFGLHDVSGTSSSDLWFAGSEQVLHYDGQDWSIEPLPCGPLSLVAIQAVAPGDVWIAARVYATSNCPAEGGLVLHRESGVFTIVRGAPDVSYVNDLWAAGPGDVWVTDTENVHHFDGTWSVIPRAGGSISGLGGQRGGTPWGFGYPRRILRKAP
jgi:hypothetical protein